MSTVTLEDIKATQNKLAEMIAALEASAAATNTKQPTTYTVAATEISLQPGERYAGLVLETATGAPSHHLVLLPGEAEDMTWEDAGKWAKEQGGDLPTRQEQSLLFANLKSEFKPNWYWSGEKASASSAWGQDFGRGGQYGSLLNDELRVRAVRRLSV
jgi:hypothetical protein